MTKVASWVQKMTEEIIGETPLKIGQEIKTDTGKTVKIISGKYWGHYGISNFWSWKRVLHNGKLSKATYCGYGYIIGGKLITKDNEEIEEIQ